MFDKREYRMYQGIKREDIYPQVCDFWARQGFYVAQLGPYHIHGQSYYSKIGLKREFYLRMDENQGNTYIDIQFQAKITDTGLVGGAAAAILLWPVAVVGGALSYTEYENDAKNLMWNFWGHVDPLAKQAGVPSPPPPPVQPPPPAAQQPSVPCQGCGALLPPQWKACPYCGKTIG